MFSLPNNSQHHLLCTTVVWMAKAVQSIRKGVLQFNHLWLGLADMAWHSRLRFEKCIENLPDVIWITIERVSAKAEFGWGAIFNPFQFLCQSFFCEDWKFQHWKILHWDAYPKVNYACRSGCCKTVISTNFKHFLMVMGINLLGILLSKSLSKYEWEKKLLCSVLHPNALKLS